MKPLEDHLADYLLGLVKTSEIGSYCRSCFNLWSEKYGPLVAGKAEKIVRERWNEKKGKKT